MKSFFSALFSNVRSVIGLIVILCGFGFLYALLFIKVPTENQHIIDVASGIVLGVVVSVGAYYFGSAKDISDKTKNDQTNLQSPPPPQIQSTIVDKP